MPILNMVTKGRGGGGNIGEPLNLKVTTIGLDATITWEDNEIGTIPPTSFVKSELVRKIGSAPTSPSDGVLVVTETVKDTYKVSGYVDQGLTNGTTYYYRVFSYSDLGGISYCDAVSVTISGGWQPGVNTLAYRKFDGDLTDEMGNYDLTAYNNSYQFDTLSGTTKCLTKTAKGNSFYNSLLSTSIYNSSFTVSLYIKPSQIGNIFRIMGSDSDWSALQYENHGGGYNWYGLQWYNNSQSGRTSWDWTPVVDNWYNIVITGDGTTYTAYVNGQELTKTLQGTFGTSDETVLLGNNGALSDGSGMLGSFSNVIIESEARTAQEVADYFDQTKGAYGIS